MKKATLQLSALAALLCVAGSASAAGYGIETSGKGNGEPTLDAIVKSGYSDGTTVTAGLDATATFVNVPSGLFFSTLGSTPASYKAHFSGNNTDFGFYDAANSTSKTLLTTFTNSGVVSGGGTITGNSFGLYITDQPSSNTFYSQANLNAGVEGTEQSVNSPYNPYGGPISSYQHIAVYQSNDPTKVGTYYIGFEDLTGTENGSLTGIDNYGGGSDRDFNDVVIELDGVALNQPIPEPAFYQMGVLLAGGGLMAVRLRRRSK